ncbi:DsbA family protein [Sphingomonadaceae bacterium OTU29THOMA1]|uniref:thioredoxin domain-containing protein n=1 Tax=Sphingomonas sp. Leaf37 TaxID=2876552 RepID=UPI001E3E877A|nr:thioredoxin domain-containing protein [Sphingomonas sp. Leaf37]USU11154.1 DsbA family protein [Sphingomonadaceae bacterium OTU29THOMA1]
MKLLASLLILPLAIAGCSSETGTPSAPASPVAAVTAPAGQNWTDTVSRTAEGTIVGNPDAPIKLVEYGSRLCPTCGALARESFGPLMNIYVKSGKVSFEYREFLVHGAPDLPPALLGNCTDPAAFFPILDQMYQAQDGFNTKLQATPQPVQAQLQTAKPVEAIRIMAEQMGLIDFAKQRGIPEAKARQCLGDMAQIDRWTKQTQDKSADGTVAGTPTLLINGKKAEAVSWGQLEPLLKAAGA